MRIVSTLLLICILLTACERIPTAPTTRLHSSDLLSPNTNATHDLTIQAFEVALSIPQNASLGLIPVTVTVTPRVAVPDLRLVIHAPEISLASQVAWAPSNFKIRVGEVINPIDAFTLPMALTGPAQRTFPITVNRPGQYQLIVTGRSAALGETIIRNDTVYQNLGRTATWLVISEAGAKLVELPTSTQLPPGALPTIGPFRYGTPHEGSTIRAPHGPSAIDEATQAFRVAFFHPDSQKYVPLGVLRVDFEEYDSYEGVVRANYPMYTDANGVFVGDCPYDYYTVHTYAPVLDGPRITMDHQMWVASQQLFGSSCSTTSDTVVSIVTPTGGHVYAQMNDIATTSEGLFGFGMGKVRVNVLASGSSNFTNTDGTRIDLISIWDSQGRGAQAHEYGHALHFQRLGGPVHASSDCTNDAYPGRHPYNEPQNLKCAIGEGFASFHSVLVYPTSNWLFDAVESGVAEGGAALVPNGVDGSTTPHAVAGMLLDLVDNTPSEESVAYPARYVGEIMQTCEYRNLTPINWYRYNGADHVIWCLEGTVDQSVTSNPNFFTTRYPDPIGARESATEPSDPNRAQNVRQQWMRNLYPWM